jgi:hypothetical protein
VESAPKTEEPTVEPLAETSADAPAAAAEETPAPQAEPKPKRSERRPAALPCSICFPNGWSEGSTAVGCEHGSWKREDTD